MDRKTQVEGLMDGETYGQMEQQTDRPSYIDVRSHLKRRLLYFFPFTSSPIPLNRLRRYATHRKPSRFRLSVVWPKIGTLLMVGESSALGRGYNIIV